MDGGNSVALTSTHLAKKKKKINDKVFKSGSVIGKIKSKIPNDALKLFEGGK